VPQPPLKVLLVSPGSGTRGGGELYLAKLGTALSAQGHAVTTWIPALRNMDELADLLGPHGRVVRSSYRPTYHRKARNLGAVLDLATIHRCAAEWKALRPDVIHLNKQNTEDALDLLLACERTNLPTLTTIHVTRGQRELGAVGGFLRDAVSRAVLRRTRSHFLAIARGGESSLRRFVAIPTPIHLVYNGAPSLSESEREQRRREARGEWGCTDQDVVFGCLGRMEQQKNPLFFLELIARLRKIGLPVRGVWVGAGSMEASFRARSAELGIEHYVHFDGWRANGQSRMCGFDVFALPSLFEGFPFVLPEAMHCALPCMATNVDGNSEAVVDGVTGWLCPVNDLEAWTTRATELARSAELRARIGAAGLLEAEQRFSLEVMARETALSYRALLGSSTRSTRWTSGQLLDVDR
jgi:glycosyltransferase involved in cell wall biosynthesis